MITRSNLADQLREYQIRSKHDWASVSFFASTSNFTSPRVLLTFACSFMHMRSGMTFWALKLDLGVVVHGR
ncbi:hypothetical protein NC652_005161 [Populus alba x Populus x berolinensis]|uniref:Uncharacterized protein n=2 Tax=Populus TaxID=3689 RepID=A0ACC4CPE9_POPAL|nr:hypothetical protein NC652_005161 [Populus alba x Populus x berolinensis]KAJ7005694.1 hypothetical protein NC653_005114 [Populus alba x Populus x berolinensis]